MTDLQWVVETGSSYLFPDAPEGTGRLFFGGEYVGTLDLAWAIRIARQLNAIRRALHDDGTIRFGGIGLLVDPS